MTKQKAGKALRRLLQLTAIVFVAVFLVQGIVATAVSEDPAQARAADGIAASRQVDPSAGDDFRLGVPDGDWISGRLLAASLFARARLRPDPRVHELADRACERPALPRRRGRPPSAHAR